MRPPYKPRRVIPLPIPANDKDGAMVLTVSCDLPKRLGILSGESELIARFLPELLKAAANDNEME